MKLRTALFVLLLGAVVAGYATAQEEGGNVGKIITVGEDRIVVAVHDKGQMTFEVRSVKDGDEWILDRAMLAQIKTLKAEQMVHVMWRKGDGGHMFISEMFVGPEDGARQGIITGTVIATGEGRIVVGKEGGGQVTLEPQWVRRQGKWGRNPFHELFAQGLQPGDEVVAMWELDEGTHFVIRGISKVDPEGQALAATLLQAELRESYQMIRELQDQIGGLRGQVNKLLEELKKKDAE